MIYHEVALEPTAVQDIKDLGLVQRTFGFEFGRLISLFPAKPKGETWIEKFHQHLKTITPVEKHKELEIKLPALYEKAIYRSRNQSKFAEAMSWKESALAEHASNPFAAILCADETCDGPVVPFQKLHAPDEDVPEFLRKSQHFTETLKDPDIFLENLKPLIMSAKKIHLIDPYLNPVHASESDRRRWQKTIKKLAEFLRNANRLTIDIELHTKADSSFVSADEFVRAISTDVVDYFPPSTNLRITAWSDKYQGPLWHARYLLTDKAGVALDYGLDMATNRRTDVTLLGPLDAEKRRKEFNANEPSTYHMEASTTATGRRTP
jgi:hypothetical protein